LKLNSLKILIKSSFVVAIIFVSQIAGASPTEISEQKNYKLKTFTEQPSLFKNNITAKQWTVVMFWASDCHVCNVEAQQFVKLHRDYNKKNIRVLGVSVDGNEKKSQAQEFIDNHNINFPNLIGEPDNIADLYKAYTNETWLGTPSIMVFSPEGKIMAHRIGMLPTDLIIKFIEGQSN